LPIDPEVWECFARRLGYVQIDPAQHGLSLRTGGLLPEAKSLGRAKKVAERTVAAHPDQKIGRELLELIERRRISRP
jgi:hypothetical protein